MRGVLSSVMALFLITFVSGVALAVTNIEVTVKVPVDYTAESKQDSAERRLVVTGGGAYIEFFNEVRGDTLTVIRDETIVNPEIKTCAGSGNSGPVCVKHFNCPGASCSCSSAEQQDVTIHALNSEECANSIAVGCAETVSCDF